VRGVGGIPHEQLCFTCNNIYEMVDPAAGRAVPQEAAIKLSVRADDPIPPRCKERPAFKAAFEELLKDGGIGKLRRLIREDLARAVAEEMQRQARADLGDLALELTGVEEAEDRRHGLNEEERRNARVCYRAVYEVLGRELRALGIAADAALTLNELLAALPPEDRPPWTTPPPREPWYLPGADILAALRRVLPADGILVADVTRLAYILMAEFPLNHPRTFLHPAGAVAMGYGIPAALGAKAAFPGRAVVAVVGDGTGTSVLVWSSD